jgi:hypothetical protein
MTRERAVIRDSRIPFSSRDVFKLLSPTQGDNGAGRGIQRGSKREKGMGGRDAEFGIRNAELKQAIRKKGNADWIDPECRYKWEISRADVRPATYSLTTSRCLSITSPVNRSIATCSQ